MHVTQVLQGGFFLLGHALGEIRISEALVACGLRHILQDTEFLLDHLLAVPGHLLHFRQHIIFDVVALLRSQIAPSLFLVVQIGALGRRHVIPLIELLANLGLLIGRQILKRSAVLQNAFALCGCHRTHLVNPGTSCSHAQLLALV